MVGESRKNEHEEGKEKVMAIQREKRFQNRTVSAAKGKAGAPKHKKMLWDSTKRTKRGSKLTGKTGKVEGRSTKGKKITKPQGRPRVSEGGNYDTSPPGGYFGTGEKGPKLARLTLGSKKERRQRKGNA